MIAPLFPLPPSDYDRAFIARLLEAIRAAFAGAVGKTEAVEAVYLLSPAGKVYKITVSDSGELQSTETPLGRS